MRTVLVALSMLALAISPSATADADAECVAGSTIGLVVLDKPVTEPAVVSCGGFACTAMECVGAFVCERAGGCDPVGVTSLEVASGRAEVAIYVDSEGSWCSLLTPTGGRCGVRDDAHVPQGATYTIECIASATAAAWLALMCGHEP